MSEETDEGAIATVRYFINAANLAFAQRDSKLLTQLHTPDCGFCRGFKENIDERSGVADSIEFKLGEIIQVGRLDSGYLAVEAEVTELQTNASGEEDRSVNDSVFALEFIDDSWKIREISE